MPAGSLGIADCTRPATRAGGNGPSAFEGTGTMSLPADVFRAERAVAAGTVLDHYRLAELLGERHADDARGRVGRANGREADDEADRLRGIGLGSRGRGEQASGESEREQAHGSLLR